jgi:peptidyl-prolyl cis-trans isomerase D
VVATVDGQKIMQQEWENAQRMQIDRYRGMLGAQFDQKMFETPEAKQNVLEGLVAERAIAAEIARNHLSISDDALAQLYAQNLKRPDGSFDKEQYKSIAAQQGLTTAGLDAKIRRDMAVQQLNGAIANTAFAPRSVSNRLSDINDQEREVQELIVPSSEFIGQVKVTDEMVKAYYDKNANQFQIPEQVKIEYVVFDANAVESLVTVSDAEVADFYAKNQKRFGTTEARSASHILVNTTKDMNSAAKAAAKAKAEAILAEVRKAPADFAKIAKAQSQDPSSAELGGDLGVIEKGAFPSALEDAIYKLKPNEISGVIESEFGFHIVTVTKLAPATTKTLDEVKGEITAELKKQKMSKKYSELAEEFTDTLYEQSESLKPAADKLKLKIETVDNLSRTPSPALASAPYANPKFLKAIFADEALKNKRNTEPVEVAPTTLVAGRVIEFKPAAKRPLAEVEAMIRQRVTIEEAGKLARKAGEAKLAAAKASGDAAGFGAPQVLTRTKQPAINPAAAAEVLKADVSKLPAYVGVDMQPQGYAVYRINKVTMPAQVDAARRAADAEQITGAVSQQEMYAYIEALKKKSKAKITVETVKVEAVN